MAARRGNYAGRRSYQDFDPLLEWIQEEGSDTLVLHLPGFKKEEVRLQLDRFGNLKITGERNVEENTWIRFIKNVQVPEANYDSDKLLANFESEILKVTMPKIIIPTQLQPKPTPQKSPSVSKPKLQLPSPTQNPAVITQPQMKEQEQEQEQKQKQKQKQVDGNARGKKVTGEENERYESAEECADNGSARVKDGSIARVAASGMELRGTKQMIVNVIVDALVVLALLMYLKYSLASSKRATCD
ncbi:inactive protein RESTRICTED TEV MOVEMENT 2-like [Telopea speciosissima]|uniref:inactive protein RESTRICTED TEV MOVEMENT 2-like n=1 Tax=Telopea speciosissima TaxID=54955 RepID=UPI001CC717DA|nr:inactive protein RESTRICTED TEV MOVEMENT 2-like [Telopea speciosissima]